MPVQPRNGYTLIEVVIVLLVFGIMAAAAAPRYLEATARFRADAAARRIAADLNYLRERAMLRGAATEQILKIDAATEQYKMSSVQDIDHPANSYLVDLSKSAYPVDVVSATFTDTEGATSDNMILYDLHGLPRVGSPSVALLSGEIVVASGSQTRTIIVDPVTGRASVQ